LHGCPQSTILSISASQVLRITGMRWEPQHQANFLINNF
jgi:hypothetical protein